MFDNNLDTENCFDLFETRYIEAQSITTGSNYMFGNGYMGYRGTHTDAEKADYAACIVADTYDNADGKWCELCNVPNGLFASLTVNGHMVSATDISLNHYRRQIDLQSATLRTEFSTDQVVVKTERFASMDQLHILAMKYVVQAKTACEVKVTTGIDGDVWSINGEHFVQHQNSAENSLCMVHTVTKELGTDVYVAEKTLVRGVSNVEENIQAEERKILRVYTSALPEGASLVIEKFVSIYSSNDVENPKVATLTDLDDAVIAGYTKLVEKHKAKWHDLWVKHDITIAGNRRDQSLTRFNIYHNIIHTPTHALLPIGARGLSCQAYQGAAFWDQEIFNLPMYLYTSPEVAKNVLKYRYETLEGARTKAKRLGYRGAFYAWISGKTGDELCPDFFFKDVISGRKIRNHFNIWQIHVSSDIAYTIWRYYEVTGDKEFLHQYGAEMMLDISLFLLSRAFFNVDKGRYEYIRLLGPDEYHENVDNNVFTNYQAKYSLQKTMEVYAQLKTENPTYLSELMEKLGITDETINTFQDMIDRIYIKSANEDKIIEQFDHYFDLEDVTPHELSKRLIDQAEYWGWPNGVAVHTQVLKQADLIQLFVLHDDFDKDTLKANFDYYEPRTEHGSSLSPAMYSIIASKVGYDQLAYDYFIKSCTVDLYSANKAISGGTFIGGIHTASCGAVWQMIIFGFAGFSEDNNVLHFNPAVPAQWDGFDFRIHHKLNFIDVSITRNSMVMKSQAQNKEPLTIDVYGQKFTIGIDETVTIDY